MLTVKQYSLKLTLICVMLIFARGINAQTATDTLKAELAAVKEDVSKWKNLKVSGWIQAQWQWADSAGVENYAGGNFAAHSNNRFTIRRGRIKFTYTGKNTQYVLQLNGTERGLNVTDFFAKVTEPWTKSLSLTVGIQNRPFGFEIQQSSQDRETPERSRFVQILLPNERDMGAMITYQPTKESKLYGLKVDGGFFNGNGIVVPGTTRGNQPSSNYRPGQTFISGVTDFDYIKDFIGRAHYSRSFKEEKYKLGVGASYYNGGFIYQNNQVYNTIVTDASGNKTWVIADTINKSYTNGIAPRKYFGAELQFAVKTFLGETKIRGEYQVGSQSGISNSTASPAYLPTLYTSAGVATIPAIFVRQFNAGNAYFVQRLGKSKHEVVVKYDWYDPNTAVSGDDIKNGSTFTKADIKYTTLGVGYLFYHDTNVKFMFYYDFVKNENTKLTGFTQNVKDNIFTARVQYRF